MALYLDAKMQEPLWNVRAGLQKRCPWRFIEFPTHGLTFCVLAVRYLQALKYDCSCSVKLLLGLGLG